MYRKFKIKKRLFKCITLKWCTLQSVYRQSLYTGTWKSNSLIKKDMSLFKKIIKIKSSAHLRQIIFNFQNITFFLCKALACIYRWREGRGGKDTILK